MIRLREPATEDAEALLAAVRESLPELSPWMPWATPAYDRDGARAWIEDAKMHRIAGTAHEFFIVGGADRIVGTCGVNRVDPANRRANLGYWVRSSEAGRGVAPEATRRLVEWVFSHTDLHRLEIVAALGNTRSQRVAEKAGAEREGILRTRLWLHGQPHDAVAYSIIRPATAAPGVSGR